MSKTPKTYEEKIAVKDEQIQQLLNQKKQLIQKQKADERKERTSRLCRRHGLLEKYMPDLIVITDEQFEQFVKRGIDTKYGNQILSELVAKEGVSTVSLLLNSSTINNASSNSDVPNLATNGNASNTANPPKAEQSGA